MNLAVVRGVLSRAPDERVLPSGDRLVAYTVTTPSDAGPADTVPVVWFEPPRSAAALAAGDEVVAVGRIRRRFFRADGATRTSTEVVAEKVLPARQERRSAALLAAAAERLAAVSG